MLRQPVTVPIAFVKGMVSGVEGRGHSCADLLVAAGISTDLLKEPGARVAADQYVALFKLLIERFDDECLGFLSRPVKRGSLALMTRYAMDAQTLDGAMRRVAHSFRLLQDDVLLEVRRDDRLAGVALRVLDAGRARPAFLHELLLRVVWRLLAWLAGGQLPIVRFDFAFAIPVYAGSYGKVFPAPLHFGCAQSAFWFDAVQLHKPVHRDEAAMRAFLADAHSQVIVPRRGDDLCSARVRRHLQQTQPQWPDLLATAAALHMSTSTLQRRLAKEGTSFQSLKDELRRDTAIVRLISSTLPLATLAFELGFADSAAFQRAFKTWTGSAPGAYRHSHRSIGR